MQRQPRLRRSQVVARLRELAKHNGGAVSPRLVAGHDRRVLTSLRLHFPTFALACRAARVQVAGPPPRSVLRRRPTNVWSQAKVVDELQRLAGDGVSTGWAELMERGAGGLVNAAVTHAGGLQLARADAGVHAPERLDPVPRWDEAAIADEIRARARAGQPLAASRAPQRFVAAARWHYGTWEAALEAAGVDAGAARLQRTPYTRDEILELIRALARDGKPVRPSTLKPLVKLDSIRKLFGSIDAAIREAGIEQVTTHGNQKWSRERVIEELQARAERGETTLTRGLHRAVQLYFGGAHAAREAAGLEPLLRTAWTRETLAQELQQRARRGDSSRSLWSACKRLFGSVAAAREAASVPPPERSEGMASWDRDALLRELRRRRRTGQQLCRGLVEGLRREFGTLAAARAALPSPPPRRKRARPGSTAPAASPPPTAEAPRPGATSHTAPRASASPAASPPPTAEAPRPGATSHTTARASASSAAPPPAGAWPDSASPAAASPDAARPQAWPGAARPGAAPADVRWPDTAGVRAAAVNFARAAAEWPRADDAEGDSAPTTAAAWPDAASVRAAAADLARADAISADAPPDPVADLPPLFAAARARLHTARPAAASPDAAAAVGSARNEATPVTEPPDPLADLPPALAARVAAARARAHAARPDAARPAAAEPPDPLADLTPALAARVAAARARAHAARPNAARPDGAEPPDPLADLPPALAARVAAARARAHAARPDATRPAAAEPPDPLADLPPALAAQVAAARARAHAARPDAARPAAAEPPDPLADLPPALAAQVAAARARAGTWQQWTRAEVLDRLRAWHASGGGEPDMGLVHACELHFRSIVHACGEAGVPVMAIPWTPQRIRKVLREPGVDHADPELVAACIDHFGSVTAARAAAERRQRRRQWTKELVIAELLARSRRGLKGVGRLLRDPAIRLFGSTEAALHAAAHADPRSLPRTRARPDRAR